MLLPEHSHPCVTQLLGRISPGTQPVGECRRLLCSVGQQFGLPVPSLEQAPTGVAAYAVGAHGEFAVPHLEALIAQAVEVVEALVGRGQHHPQVAILLLRTEVEPVGGVLSCASRFVLQTSSMVAAWSHIAEHSGHAIGCGVRLGTLQRLLVGGHVLVELLMGVIGAGLVDGINLAAVHPLPHSEGRQTVVGGGTPCQFGGVETPDAGMACQRG